MQCMQWSFCALITIMSVTFSIASRQGGKIHFQDSSELEQLDIDERPGPNRGNRNHRGRAGNTEKQHNVAEFEEGLPGVYPIKGPPQAPLVLPGRGARLENYRPLGPNTAQVSNNLAVTTKQYETPIFATQPKTNQQASNHPYAGNPFLSKIPVASAAPTTQIYSPPVFPGVTNHLPTSDKPKTTTPSYLNPRRTDLLYGSNLLEEDVKRGDKTEEPVSFTERGLFDTAPHCQPGQILVNNKCRLAV